MAWGAVPPAVDRSPGPERAPGAIIPAVIPVRMVALNPSTGAVLWASFPVPDVVVLNPASGGDSPAGPLSPERDPGDAVPGYPLS